MILEQKERYKSIEMGKIPANLRLPDFTIITGANGAGKTHFLDAIKQGKITLKNDRGEILNNIQLHRHFSFSSSMTSSFSGKQLKERQAELYNLYKTYLAMKKNKENLTIKEYSSQQHIGRTQEMISKGITTPFIFVQAVKKVADFWDKDIDDLKQQHFDQYIPLIGIPEDQQIFTNFCSLVFTVYWLNHDITKYRRFRAKERDEFIIPIFDEEEFKEKFGEPPWEVFNEILEKFDSDYTITYPNLSDDSLTFGVFVPKLMHKKEGTEILFNDLSSGEQVLLALISAYYNNSQHGIKPGDVLLFDEVDAPLHPSNVKKFINVLKEVFIAKKAKIILTTHKPSTVAFAEKESISIFLMRRDGIFLEKINCEEALKALSDGFVSLTKNEAYWQLNYNIENEPYVLFVEGASDMRIINKAWEMLYDSQPPFYTQPTHSCSLIRTLISRDELYEDNPEGIFFSLFDFDEAYNDWNGLGKNFNDHSVDDPYKCLIKKHSKQKSYALLLPVPDSEMIKKQVIHNGNQKCYGTYGSKSRLEIELLFYGIQKIPDKHFKSVLTPGGGEIIIFNKGEKKKFAENIQKNYYRLDKEGCKNFKPIFDFINKVIQENKK